MIPDAHADVVLRPDDDDARLLPPCPKILHGRNETVDEVASAITNCKQTALLGTGGIGKTSIAVAALHHESVIRKYGERRRFVPCDELGDNVNIDSLLQLIAKSVGLKLRGVNDQRFLLEFLSRIPVLLALDNAETVLDHPQSHDAILPFIATLALTENVSLIVTSRSTALPAEVPWNKVDVKLLSSDAAKQMLLSFYGFEDCDELSKLLEHLGCHPLSIKLIAQVGAQGRLSAPELLTRWKKYRTKLLHLRGTGPQSSLATSLDLSLNSPSLLHPPVARNVLRILAFLPQGVDELKCQALFPSIEEIDLIIDSLFQLSLIEKRHNRITLLPPIRSYIQECIPPMQGLIDDIGVYYCDTLSALSHCQRGDETFQIAKLFIHEEDANCETILIRLVDNQHPSAYLTASIFFHLLDRHLKRKKTKLGDIIRDLPEMHDLKYVDCLDAVGWLEFQMANYREAETILTRAHRLSIEIGSDWAEAHTGLSLGNLHLFLSNYEDAEAFFLRARSLYHDDELESEVAAFCNRDLAAVHRLRGNLEKARSLANLAIAQFKELEDLSSFAWSLLELGEIEWSSQNIPAAKSFVIQARAEATKLGDEDLGHKCDRLLANIAIDAGDYFQAQILVEGARKEATEHNDPHDAALCDVLLGLIQERLLHYETAKALYYKARDAIIRIGSKYDAADCAHYLGGVEKNLGDSEAAVKWFLLAGEEFLEIKVFHRARSCIDAIRSLVEQMEIRGDHEAAKHAIINAEELYSKINNSQGAAERGEKSD
jgi:tetratricopeptide (TPR) repeat protein